MNRLPQHGRVLVVDDEPTIREIYVTVLEEEGYEVAAAENGTKALDLLDARAFDLVVSDIQMPDLSGVQLLRAIRAHDLDLPVILVTGSPRLETAAEAVEYGALQYLMKPVPLDTLLTTVARGVKLHQMALFKREALTHLGYDDKLVGDLAGLEVHLERALRSLVMAYQPVVDAADGQVYAHEALVRSMEPAFPHPGALFSAAERLGRVHEVSRMIRRSVARSMGHGVSGTIFVNLHPVDLVDDALFADSSPLTEKASSVVLEITERAPIDQVTDVAARIRALRGLGYRIALDDLGAGYAGLTSFAILEPDVVKLDMSLVRGVDHEPVKQKIVGKMASLCRDLGILVVAEGIETHPEREVLVAEGCDLLQGYLLGRPRLHASQ